MRGKNCKIPILENILVVLSPTLRADMPTPKPFVQPTLWGHPEAELSLGMVLCFGLRGSCSRLDFPLGLR